jgi:hypothetical protein
MTLTDKEITDILNDAEDAYSAHDVARSIENEVEVKLHCILSEVGSELEAFERLVQRQLPDFQHPLLARIRGVLA